ncbi:MAG: CRISPR-associated ring nuclease Crn3/Csx3 [Candidatus Methanomethylicaceae archaeon]
MILFLAGPPKAGKTSILGLLKKALERERVMYFIERLSPDCEGTWTLESPDGFERARTFKNMLKTQEQFFTPEFVKFKVEGLRSLAKAFPLVIGDLGGVPSRENELLVAEGGDLTRDVLVILYRKAPEIDMNLVNSWVKFAQELGIKSIMIENKFNSTTVDEILSFVRIPSLGGDNKRDKEEKMDTVLVEINITRNGGILNPSELEELISKLPQAGGHEGVIISGRIPVWGYAAIVHHFHPRPWVCTYEPRLGKGVVVMSHTPNYKIGDLIEVPKEKNIIQF